MTRPAVAAAAVGHEVPSIANERLRTPGAEWTTYRRADGEMIYGEYAFVTELEWFESDDEPTDLIEETWVLQSARKLTVNERPPADA